MRSRFKKKFSCEHVQGTTMSKEYSPLKQQKENLRVSGRPCFVILLVLLAVYIALIIWNFVTQPQYTPVVQTLDGPVQGTVKYSRDGKEYWRFVGIPYAMPPIGERQFQPPVPVEPWKNVKQVISYPSSCAQLNILMRVRPEGELDCLYLNVYVNAVNGINSKNKPVLVYIHGGAFISGGSYLYPPDFFMDHDVVVVFIQYRLGPYGFLNLQNATSKIKENAKGNMGLKDQNLALKWIKRNIAQFGGNPNSITLIGESAGAVSTHYHIMSPMSKNLFHKAVIQSSTALSAYTFSSNPRHVAIENARKFGCPVENFKRDDSALLKCFETTDWKKLVNHQHTLFEPLQKKDMFQVTIDGTFLKTTPMELIKAGDFPPIPIMFGINSGEGSIRTGRFEAMPELIPVLDKNWTDLLHNVMILDEPVPAKVSQKLRQQYFGGMNFTENLEDFKQNITMMMSDAGFFYPTRKAAVNHAKKGAPTYLYYYNYTSNAYPGVFSMYKAYRLDDWLPIELHLLWSIVVDWMKDHVFGGRGSRPYGVAHAEDVYQLWNIDDIPQIGWLNGLLSRWDSEFSHSFVQAVVDFANDTQPLKFRDVTWPSINDVIKSGKDEYTIPYMILDNKEKTKVVAEPFASRMKFLTEIKDWLL